jgi:hypothetical protein
MRILTVETIESQQQQQNMNNMMMKDEDEVYYEITDLPRDCLFAIFLFLTPQDLLSSTPLVCQEWYQVQKNDMLWAHLYATDQYFISLLRLVQYFTSVHDMNYQLTSLKQYVLNTSGVTSMSPHSILDKVSFKNEYLKAKGQSYTVVTSDSYHRYVENWWRRRRTARPVRSVKFPRVRLPAPLPPPLEVYQAWINSK